jgi:hypothetical protein
LQEEMCTAMQVPPGELITRLQKEFRN